MWTGEVPDAKRGQNYVIAVGEMLAAGVCPPFYPTSPPPFTPVLFITCNLLSDEPRFSVYMLQSGSRPLQYFHKTNLHMRTRTHILLQKMNSTVNLVVFFLIFAMFVILSPLVLKSKYQTGARTHTQTHLSMYVDADLTELQAEK